MVFSVAKDGLPRALQVLCYIEFMYNIPYTTLLLRTHTHTTQTYTHTPICVPQTLPGAITDDVSTASLPNLTTPLYLLVNENTASAAEVLAAALKENDRAVLVGHKTFGKGYPPLGVYVRGIDKQVYT